ncbi:MAG: AI-2E family transporter [Burkholderiales bacterium]|nr:MAG: AI-2E family transporter [Burkholderiales bacterium]RPH68217.1 MAG: AI-2E family transporter [Burkholderiales bacterium]
MPLTARQRQTALWTAVATLFVWALVALGQILTPFVAAAILAYVLAPGVRWLQARRVPRLVAVVLVVLMALLALLAVLLILVPITQQEVALIRRQFPTLAASVSERLLPWLNQVFGLTLKLDVASMRDWLAGQLADSGEDWMATLFSYARSGWGAALQVVGTLLLVPVVLFYLLADWPELVARARELIPPRWVQPIDDVLDETDSLLGQYLRGQLLVMLSLAVWFSAALLVAGFDLWLPIGVLSGLLIFIPYIGFAAGFAFALVAGMLQLGPLPGAVWVIAIYGIAQVVESTWLTPRLVGERIGLHPVAVIFALLAFGSLFGFVGVLLALPLAAITAVGLRRLLAAWRTSEFYHRG